MVKSLDKNPALKVARDTFVSHAAATSTYLAGSLHERVTPILDASRQVVSGAGSTSSYVSSSMDAGISPFLGVGERIVNSVSESVANSINASPVNSIASTPVNSKPVSPVNSIPTTPVNSIPTTPVDSPTQSRSESPTQSPTQSPLLSNFFASKTPIPFEKMPKTQASTLKMSEAAPQSSPITTSSDSDSKEPETVSAVTPMAAKVLETPATVNSSKEAVPAVSSAVSFQAEETATPSESSVTMSAAKTSKKTARVRAIAQATNCKEGLKKQKRWMRYVQEMEAISTMVKWKKPAMVSLSGTNLVTDRNMTDTVQQQMDETHNDCSETHKNAETKKGFFSGLKISLPMRLSDLMVSSFSLKRNDAKPSDNGTAMDSDNDPANGIHIDNPMTSKDEPRRISETARILAGNVQETPNAAARGRNLEKLMKV